jgi:O-acetyl-ADP-ribose deacetylase (regulator of RNase III)
VIAAEFFDRFGTQVGAWAEDGNDHLGLAVNDELAHLDADKAMAIALAALTAAAAAYPEAGVALEALEGWEEWQNRKEALEG